jgi:hypothetical protein
MVAKSKEQLLEELSAVQKMLEEKTAAQGHMIKKFQALLENEGLFSQIIDLFPYPIAIFTSQLVLVMVNKAFSAVTKNILGSPEKGDIHILQYTIEDAQLAQSVTRVFSGETFILENVKKPFSMFMGIEQQNNIRGFVKVAIFPVLADNARVTHGVIVFMP